MVRLSAFFFLAGSAALLSAANLDGLLREVSGYEYGQDPSAVRELEAAVLKSAGTAEAAATEKQLLQALASAKTLAAKDALCRDLSVIGGSESIPALARMLVQPETAEMARYALERILGPAATEALRQALPQAPAQAKPGIVVSLGRRKDAAAAGSLKPLLSSSDVKLADAAAAALGHIGTPDARQALMAAQPNAAVNDALLEIASRSADPLSAEIYRRMQTSGASEAARMAALRGLARTEGKKAVPLLTAALKNDPPRLKAVAIRELAGLDRAALLRESAGLDAPLQVQVIAALVDSGQADVLPVLQRSMSAEAGTVRIAALQGLAKLGSAREIPALAARAAQSTGDEQAAARVALASILGNDADAAILQAIPSAESKTRVELIRAAGDRGIRTAPDVLLKTALDADRTVRAESIRALRETAGPAQVPALLALLVKTEDESDRKEYERAVAYAIRRSKEPQVADLTAAYQKASEADVQSSLLAVMAAVGSSDSLPVVRQALQAKDADVQRAAINALANWPTAEPTSDLLTLAQTAKSPAQQVLALRGYIKLVQIPSSRTTAETAKMLAAGMEAAKRADERKLILAAAQRVAAPESLELVRKSLNDPEVAAEAKQAATALERSLSYRRN